MIREGTQVRWAWGDGHAAGEVVERAESTMTRTINGEEITRHGSSDDPALLIRQDDGQEVLKLHREVERADSA